MFENLLQFFITLAEIEYFYLFLLLAYFLGSIPFGYLIARIFLGYDVRSQGSGNIGMTNVMRTGGKIPGLFTFLLDLGKGTLAVWITGFFTDSTPLILCSAFLVVFGHTSSIFLKFKGGKGISTNFGIWILLDWRIFLAIALTWVLLFLWKKISSLSALLSLIVLPIASFVFQGSGEVFILSCLLFIYLFFLHRSNIKRLLQSEESALI